MKILLVDDSKTMRGIQKRALSELPGSEVSEAGDGLEALEILASQKFDLVLVDWNMPKMDGITLVNKFRQADKTTPLVMCTTEAEKSRIIEAIKAGVNNYIVKPFTSEGLIEKVKATLSKAAA
jgi:two-component system chemotaxis response regulator CheY